MKNLKQRDVSIDASKGILIILVVLGHSGFKYKDYIYWFHMPAFFFISGILFKDISSFSDLKQYMRKKIIGSLGYYVLFLILFSVIEPYYTSVTYNKQYLYNHIFGRRLLMGIHGIFWFVTCLLITQLAFAVLNYFTKSKIIIFTFMLICYSLAHVQAYSFALTNKRINYPLNADVALFAIMFFGLGYMFKNPLEKILSMDKIKLFPLALIINLLCLIPLYLNHIGKLNYVLDMKYSIYNNFILDLLIPLLFTFAIIIDSYPLRNMKILQSIGKNSFWIMYFHLPLNYVLRKNINYNWLPFLLIGTFIPLLIGKLIGKKS